MTDLTRRSAILAAGAFAGWIVRSRMRPETESFGAQLTTALGIAALTAAGVEGRAYYNPSVHRHRWFSEHPDVWVPTELPATEALCAEVLSLPIHDDMASADLERVIEAVASCPDG